MLCHDENIYHYQIVRFLRLKRVWKKNKLYRLINSLQSSIQYEPNFLFVLLLTTEIRSKIGNFVTNVAGRKGHVDSIIVEWIFISHINVIIDSLVLHLCYGEILSSCCIRFFKWLAGLKLDNALPSIGPQSLWIPFHFQLKFQSFFNIA